ncbi:MAG TPA: hypothetical protein VH989_11370, partial [Actinomycetota bacterium]
MRVLKGVHHALTSDVVHEQRDRRGKRDFLDISVESHASVPADLLNKRLDCLSKSLSAKRAPVQVTDYFSDPV